MLICLVLLSRRHSARCSRWSTAPADAQPSANSGRHADLLDVVQHRPLLGSQKNVNCIFKGQPGEPEEAYTGTMTTIGLDIGVTTGGAIVWAVFAGTNRQTGMLAGTYAGATAEASIAAGLGANVLVGGSNRTVALQPLSVQGQNGLQHRRWHGALELHPAR